MNGTLEQDGRVLFIGAAGQMARIVVERFARASNGPLLLTDIYMEPVEALAATLPKGRATAQKLDLQDRPALLQAVQGSVLVVLCAGPYTKTSHPVISACLESRVPYLDFDDDVESTQAALDLTEQAKQCGIPIFIGCGASPGMTNVLAVDVARDLDTVDEMDICWLVGNERSGAGRAVIEHLMHIAAGPCLTWADGRATLRESYVEMAYAPMLGHSEMLLHETAHPEPVTLPRLFPTAKRIRCVGGLYPPQKWGIARGLGVAVRSGLLPINDAVDFQLGMRQGKVDSETWGTILQTLVGRFPHAARNQRDAAHFIAQAGNPSWPWMHAVNGLISQVESGECTAEETVDFVLCAAKREQRPETTGSLLVRAIGTRNGHPSVAIRRTPTVGTDSYLMSKMATVTGTSCAAFIVMALKNRGHLSGVFSPEDWAKPEEFYKALERVGTPRKEIVETYTH